MSYNPGFPFLKFLTVLFIQLELAGELSFAKVYFYLRLNIGQEEKTLALVSVYSPPDRELLEASYFTLWSCRYQGNMALKVVDVKTIVGVVAMVLHGENFTGDTTGRFFVVEKPGLDVAHMGGNDEIITEE